MDGLIYEIMELGMGIAPTTFGLQNRCDLTEDPCENSANATSDFEHVGQHVDGDFTPDDLAALIAAWPCVPERVRRAIVTLVESVRENQSAT